MAKKQFNTILEELNKIKNQLNEDYVFNGDDGMYGDEGMEDQSIVDPQQSQDGMSEEEKAAMHAHDIIEHEPIIGKIRETAIEGLKKYADYPTSPIYLYFRKVFLDSDKVLTDEGSNK